MCLLELCEAVFQCPLSLQCTQPVTFPSCWTERRDGEGSEGCRPLEGRVGLCCGSERGRGEGEREGGWVQLRPVIMGACAVLYD